MSNTYYFHGHESVSGIKAKNNIYEGIVTPTDLYDALSKIWCADTCAPRMRKDWSEDNRTLGQCSITAFLAQDIFGGIVRGMPTENGGVHCYNVVDGIVFDLTSEQYGDRAKDLVYADDDLVQERESAGHFGKEEKKKRYEYLKKVLEINESKM